MNDIVCRYTYDDLGQLIREDNRAHGATYTWTYDNAGNILSSKTYAYTTGTLGTVQRTVSYDYSSGSWGDLLTSYWGNSITYDGVGNPLTWGDYGELTWQGRRLMSYSDSESGDNYSYTYNADGIRTSKTVNGVKHIYHLSGTQILSEEWTEDRVQHILIFVYDASGQPIGMSHFEDGVKNGDYLFAKNVQGDITAVYDANGTCLVTYTYDAWGNTRVRYSDGGASTAARYNPLRYRGYYYDIETGFYYVSSRYYDPEVGRWINADNQIAGVGGEVLGYNMFAYCMNNPVNMSDPSGNWPRWATIALGAVAAVAAVAVTVVTLGAAAPAAACTLTTVGMSIGASYAVASTAATVAVAATTVAAAAYAGDIAYSAVTGDSLLLNTVYQGNTDAYNTGLAITSIATAGMLEMAAQSPGVCFVAGTPVLAACGYIAIEEIKAGDMVWAENPKTGKKELKEVVQTFVNETTELIYVYVGNEEIVTTPEHPFYSPIKGWIAACKLRAGDILVLQNGKYVTVEKVQNEILEVPITVYNFEVADFHTYYVGKSAVLVHNTCGGKPTSPNQMQKQVERGQAPSTVVRVDNPKIPGQLPHIHFSDGTAMNIDGSVHDAMRGVHTLTNSERIWIFDNGWGG